MYFQPKSLLSRLLGAAWTVLLIALLLWLTVQLLARVWLWILLIAVLVVLIWIGIRWWKIRREIW